jgi:NADH:ubiquinone oxidoreductase subunit D
MSEKASQLLEQSADPFDRACIKVREMEKEVEALREELARLKAEAKPEPEEFWPDELVEYMSEDDVIASQWRISRLKDVPQETPGSSLKRVIRKLRDTTVLQFRPLAEGERLPEGEWLVVGRGGVPTFWSKTMDRDPIGIIGYATVKPVREG